MRVYAKLHGFETVFDNDPYVMVGADGNDRESITAQGVSTSMYERQHMDWVFLSQALQSNVNKSTFHRSTYMGNWYKIGTTQKPMPEREYACGSSITLKSGWRMT